MSAPVPYKYAFNRTRCQYLATELEVAQTHWTRLCGLITTDPQAFRKGCGLWIVPCHGVHTLAMRFPIDAVYLDANRVVVHLEENIRPWRIAPVRMHATSVLELPGNTVHATGTILGDEIEIAVDHTRMANHG